ncbi:NAD(P)/FAD-dependent oxidoreductase [Cupriavidus sp. AU9028]|uniref:flavin-containing monooxygenase n=1 Tax=Cupriavidus sp. AU9028 TaxID=2871157 RepID=UPI001C97013C|nr:NAD(P)-binding domain-containing protein [Cupriavidus sp. AU9028]MBY4897015.1 NAD(P)-binding domain-containing protein [Cupriavidus sp. AU9028]
MTDLFAGAARTGNGDTAEIPSAAAGGAGYDAHAPREALPVCIVGAGSSGVAAAKALKEQGVAFDCYETGSAIGGMWRYQNDNGMSSAYRSLHIDTSRINLGYSDFPIPAHYPDFLSHFEVMEYLDAYADRFAVKPHIQFRRPVKRIDPLNDGSWRVTLEDGASQRYRAVIVANGHLWDPRWPSFEGEFSGEQIHSHDYRTADPYRDKTVVVVGIGNSAVDIAVDVCKSAKRTFLSTRRSAWVIPKYIMGYPTDRWSAFFSRRLKLPTRATRTLIRWLAWLAIGDQARVGIPRPAHPIWREHATLSQELVPYCGHGWIRMKPNIDRLDGSSVRFADGSREAVDAIIYATGYKTTFPFLDPGVFQVEDGKAELYRRIVAPGRPGLFLLGLVQPIGPTIPLVEIQSKWIAAALSGQMRLPEAHDMAREIDAHRAEVARRYVGSARYTLEVDFRAYARQMARDMRRGRAGA